MPDKLRAHIKNNRAGEFIFRVTPERFADACARHAGIAARLDATIDWDLDNFEDSIASADCLLTWDLPTTDLAHRAPQLRWIHVIGAGVEHLQPLGWLPPGVKLINNKGVHAPKTEEYALMALTALNARLPAFMTQQRAHNYNSLFTPRIAGKTLLVVGAGHMGCAVARAGKKLGLRLLGIRRSPRATAPFDETGGPDRLDDWLVQADFVVLTTPVTNETRGLMDARRLALMKPGAGLVNLSRAAVLDRSALCQNLDSGHLSGAILDVVEPEPLPAESTLWDQRNLIITPHVSSDDEEAYIPLTLDLFFDNCARTLSGEPLRNVVDVELGY